jgi:chromatin structure-remodeling complex subunit RSC9
MLPGTGFTGPNIYMRCLRALESNIPDEVKYALHHLVKISFERGDKFLFSQFTNLADELMRKVCAVSTAWYDHPGWNYTWTFGDSDDARTLNELAGTSNLIDKIQSYTSVEVNSVHTEQFDQTMNTAYQACLVLRNMIVLDDNAKYLSEMPLIRDMMTIIFQLPKRSETVELKYYALEIAELLTKYWVLEGNDPLYLSLLEMIEDNTTDRGLIIIGLRAVSRIALTKEAVNKLENVPVSILNHVSDWLLVDDEELRSACLDFLYQYTAVTENVAHIVKIMDTEGLIDTIMNFLMLGAIRIALNPEQPQAQEEQQAVVSTEPADILPKLSPSVVQALCQISDPKEQSSAWYVTTMS